MASEAGGEFKDVDLLCSECGREFVHTKEKQEFYAAKGLDNLPKRCPECREKRRTNQKRQVKPRAGAGGPPRPRSGGWGDRDRDWKSGPRPQFDVVCAQCGKPTTVSFKPTGIRPVYCAECFRERGR